jgi:hypothetical protein
MKGNQNTFKKIIDVLVWFTYNPFKIKKFRVYLNWVKNGKPMIKYPGFHCGCCGCWTEFEFEVPECDSDDWWDTWGLCEKCSSIK